MFTSKKKYLLLIPVVAIIAALGYYFLYWTRTPMYALQAARQAITQHDEEKFERYVDINSVMDKAFDDFIAVESQPDGENFAANPFAMGILHMLKPAVVELMVTETKESIANSGASTDSDQPQRVDPVTDAMRKNMENKIQLDKLSIKDVSLVNNTNGKAQVAVVVHNSSLDKDFTLDVNMEHNDNGDWQIKEISNLKDFIKEIKTAVQAKVAAESKTVDEKLTSTLPIIDKKLSIVAEKGNGANKLSLNAVVKVKNASNKAIDRIYYDLVIFDSKGAIIYSYPERFAGSIKPGAYQLLDNSKLLNLQLPADKLISGLDLSKVNWKLQPNYIRFDDGSVIVSDQFEQ